MATTQEYRDQLAQLKVTVEETTAGWVRDGYIKQRQANRFLVAAGLTPVEDEATRQAREELEAFKVQLREAIVNNVRRTDYRDHALHAFGV